MLFIVSKSEAPNLLDLESDIRRETRACGMSTAPVVVFYTYDDDSFIVDISDVACLGQMLIQDYNAVVYKGAPPTDEMKIDDKQTVYTFMTRDFIKVRGKSVKFLPKHVVALLAEQSEVLQDAYCKPDKDLSAAIYDLIGKTIESDSKLVWTVEKPPKGATAYLLQVRTPHLTILVKVAENNFANMFVKLRYPPSGENLKALQATCEELKFKLFGSIYKGDCFGLVDFYDFIREKF
jgi:hypothetical protein